MSEQTIGELLAEHFGQTWGSEVEIERKRRINLAAWAYAYEIENDPIVDDATFDREAALVRPNIETGRPELDQFFKTIFAPFTGQWIHEHPDKEKLPRICAAMRT